MRKLAAMVLAVLLAVFMPILNTQAEEGEAEPETPAPQEMNLGSDEEQTPTDEASPEDEPSPETGDPDTIENKPGEQTPADEDGSFEPMDAPSGDPESTEDPSKEPEPTGQPMGEGVSDDFVEEKLRKSREHPAASKSLESWEETRKELPLTGDLREDILIIARSQIGYTADRSFFERDQAGNERYYTRYGAWYGWPFADWCDMFVSFCVHYAGAADYPMEASCARHMFRLKRTGYWREWNCYVPRKGDIVFFRISQGSVAPNHVGIIEKVVRPKGDEPGYLVTIEGNLRNPDGGPSCVRRMTRSLEDVVGYGVFEKGSVYPETYSRQSDGQVIIKEDSPYFVDTPTQEAMSFLGLVGSPYYGYWFPGEPVEEGAEGLGMP